VGLMCPFSRGQSDPATRVRSLQPLGYSRRILLLWSGCQDCDVHLVPDSQGRLQRLAKRQRGLHIIGITFRMGKW